MSSAKGGDTETIRELEKLILSSNENLNNVAVILKLLDTGKDETKFYAMKSLQRIFSHFIDLGDIVHHVAPTPTSKKQKQPKDALSSVQTWLRKKYFGFVNALLNLLHNEEPGLQIPALEALMAFVLKIAEAHARLEGAHQTFVNILFPSVVAHLVMNDQLNEKLLEAWREKYLWKFDDVRFFTLVSIRLLLETRRSGAKLSAEFTPGALDSIGASSAADALEKIPSETFIQNIYEVIRETRMPTDPSELDGFFAGAPAAPTEVKVSKKRKLDDNKSKLSKASRKLAELAEHRKVFTKCWLEFLKLPLPVSVYKQVLTTMHEMILPHLTTPVLLMDFLSSSYNIGGVVSLLSLNGLFYLMHKHNLEYPDFYTKLYGLLKPDVFYVKYRARFFNLAQIFLSSTHLPTYLVCAFAKRLGRLALLAPPPVTMAILPLIYNIMVMHPAAHILLHRAPKHDPTNQVLMLKLDSSEIIKSDPFIFDEMDPSKCNASASSLWEVQALMNHYVPAVSTMAKIFDLHGELRREKMQLDEEVIDQSYQTMLEFEMKRRNKHGFPLAFTKPGAFFSADSSEFTAFVSQPETVAAVTADEDTPSRSDKKAKRKRKE